MNPAAVSDGARQTLEHLLLADGRKPLYALMDASANDALIERLYAEPDLSFECLLPGQVEPDVFYVAPFVIEIGKHVELLRWLLSGWGANWGIYVQGTADLETTWRHLRRYVLARLPDGRPAYLRYYDPRVCTVIIEHLKPEQVAELFAGPVESIFCETEDGNVACRFGFEGGKLMRADLPLGTRRVAA
jgi:hypothetical protein